MVWAGLLAAGAAEGIKLGRHYWENNKHKIAKKARDYVCQSYGSHSLVDAACKASKSWTQNPGQSLLERPRRVPKSNRAISGVAGNAGLQNSTPKNMIARKTRSRHVKKLYKKLRKYKH